MKKLVALLAIAPTISMAQVESNTRTVAAVPGVSSVAWQITEELTLLGPRPAATERELKAREWATGQLAALGLKNVRIEPFTMPAWVRGDEVASINGQRVAITALGNSGTTGPKGLTGELYFVGDFEDLKAATPEQLKGKIVYATHAMKRTQDGSSYGYYGDLRRKGPNIAARKGAAALIIRSIGTDTSRNPHAGGTNWDKDVTPIPAAAISNVDADQIERLLKDAKRSSGLFVSPRFTFTLTPRFVGEQASGNVIAEIPGSDPSAGVVLAACHLDSWDLGTGAIDDASGCGIITDAALRATKGKQPRRTIRLLWAGAEEVGVFGGKAYGEAHKAERHALVAESDFGADRVWRVDFKLPDAAAALKDRLTRKLAAMGIHPGKSEAGGGADVGPLVAFGAPVVDLQQDGTRYFDLHHTPEDTLDKIDPAQLEQNVKAWEILLHEAANAPENWSVFSPK
jgi:carboxypeptidase Q